LATGECAWWTKLARPPMLRLRRDPEPERRVDTPAQPGPTLCVEHGDQLASPYRTRDAPNWDAHLGLERSVHRARVRRPLVATAAIFVAMLLYGVWLVYMLGQLGLVPVLGQRRFALAFLFAVMAGARYAIEPLRALGVRVVLYQRGLVVNRRRAREVILFSDVREVWWDRLVIGTDAAWVFALRLADGRGVSHRVPLMVERHDVVMASVASDCSARLLPEARAAFRAGQTMTFGPVTFDRDSVGFGPVRIRWAQIRLVRFVPGEVAFFRGTFDLPWETVRLDRVPHPLIFVSLLREAAPRVEIHPPVPGE